VTPTPSKQDALRYIRAKVDQLLAVMGTCPLRSEELDDDTLIALDPIGIIAESFQQVIDHLNETNQSLSIVTDEIRAILDALGAAVVVLDGNDRVDDCNRVAMDWFFGGLNRAQVVGHPAAEVCTCAGELSGIRSCADGSMHNVRLYDRDIQIVASKIFDKAGHHAQTVMLFTDISQRMQTEEALRIAATAFEVQEGMTITDSAKVILRVNKAFTEITGYSAEEAVGKTPSLLRSGHHDAAFYAAMWESIERTGTWQGEIWNRRKTGEVYPEWLIVTAVKNDAGLTTHYVGTFTDVTSRKKAEDEITNLAFYDPLTGLPNRRLLIDRLKQALASSTRSLRHGALLFLDLDNFKTLNDTRGHDIGDLLLQQVAQRLSTCVREGDTVARLGGDEFVVMLEDLSENVLEAATQTEIVGEKILATLNHIYHLHNYAHHSTPSIGITLFADHHGTIDDLLKRADLAMYQSKAAGRNTLRFFDPTMQAVVTTRAALEADLREAVQKGQFVLYYQAQMDGVGRLTGVEVLLRWQHPLRGMVSPLEFIPLAEDTGLILPLGHWVLETACAQLTVWASQPEMAHLTVAVNVSARQFHHADFVDQVLAVLDKTGANPQRLKLELTESLMVDDVEDVIAKMTALKAKGVSFSLDDFGTGYSSLSYLKRLPLDQLKIDQGFVRDILTDTNDSSIAKMVIALAESMGLAVIAEGVEIEAQKDFLASHGCHAYQGYLFSRPLPLGAFEEFVKGV
jgi:diguanylate cyclase (GGDEF)-like protein/PAS domain S-box-containing protein